MSNRIIKIGTRDSELALWQAHTVAEKINKLGIETEIVAVKSTGDIILDKPLYELGITGIFTKTLDLAMLDGKIDIAVHSMKDVPTTLPKGIMQAAVLERANVNDILVLNSSNYDFSSINIIATGSLRRKAQWLHRYPHHEIVDLRGNVNSRLQKLENNQWNGAIFAQAGLERINLLPTKTISLDWMLPAPAQGAMMVVALENDLFSIEVIKQLNDRETEICTQIERDFLKTLEGGCSAPIGALATIEREQINFTGNIFSLNGNEKASITKNCNLNDFKNFGKHCALELLELGAREIMKNINKQL
ncbi:MAG: hydroxymethylbilane synthase [Flavobacterium sp.]